jgi:hypothetical protein
VQSYHYRLLVLVVYFSKGRLQFFHHQWPRWFLLSPTVLLFKFMRRHLSGKSLTL